MKIISKSQTSDQQSRKLWSTLYTQKRWNLNFWRRMSLHKFILNPLKLHLTIYLFQTLKQRLRERKSKPIKELHIGKKLRPKKRIDAKWWEESSRKFMRKQRKEKRNKEVSRDKESNSKMPGWQELQVNKQHSLQSRLSWRALRPDLRRKRSILAKQTVSLTKMWLNRIPINISVSTVN